MDIPCSYPAADPGEVQSPSSSMRRCPVLAFDPEWLAITRAFQPYFSTSRTQPAFPGETQAVASVRQELDWVMQHVGTRRVEECQTFSRTAPGPCAGEAKIGRQREWCSISSVDFASLQRPETRSLTFDLFVCFFFLLCVVSVFIHQAPWYANPQTDAFCAMLELENKIHRLGGV